jgi:hypothetical protein
MKNRGYNTHRLHPEADNPREVAFAEAWEEHNERGALRQILNKERHQELTETEVKVAATIIQWLGSNCGMWFLRDIAANNEEIKKYINS